MTGNISQTVPATLRGELGTRELSKAALAKKLGKTSDWVTRRLRGDVAITLADLDELCRGLGLDPVLEFRPVPDPPKKTTASRSRGRRSQNTQPLPPDEGRNGR